MSVEPDTKKFLITIVNTISVILIWMIFQLLFGIYFGFAFFDSGIPVWQNILYFIFLVGTLVWLIRYVSRKWTGLF